jgi:hypothetical protein
MFDESSASQHIIHRTFVLLVLNDLDRNAGAIFKAMQEVDVPRVFVTHAAVHSINVAVLDLG